MKKFLFFMCLACLLSVGFSAPAPGIVQVPQNGALKIARSLKNIWNLYQPKKYQYKLQIQCFCVPQFTGPWLITVENGVSEAEFISEEDVQIDGDFDYAQDVIDGYGTINKLLQKVVSLLSDDFESTSMTVDVYNNIITNVFVDIDAQIADEEYSYSVSGFKVLKP